LELQEKGEERCMLSVGLFLSSFYFWDEPGSDLNKLPTNPSKTIGPPGKPEGNTTHRMCCAVSLEIVLGVTAMLICLQFRKEWGSVIAIHLLRP
jgi:hypothetical protein